MEKLACAILCLGLTWLALKYKSDGAGLGAFGAFWATLLI